MTAKSLYIYGASGQGKVVADIILAAGGSSHLAGFVDDQAQVIGHSILGLPVVGDSHWLAAASTKGELAVALGIGDNHDRQRIAGQCKHLGIELMTLIHPRATVARSALIEEGTVVMAGAVINPEAQVGAGAIINTGAIVEHDVVVGDFAHLSPNVATGGDAHIGSLAHIGLGAIILPRVRIGKGTIIGAGSVVNKDIPDNVVAFGAPCKVQRSR